MARPLRGHIALWLIGKSTDDPRVHDMLNTLTIYSIARVLGPTAFHYGKLGAFIPSVAWHYWRGPKDPKYPSSRGRGVRMLSKHGEWPIRYEYTKTLARTTPPTAGSGPASAGVARGVAARTMLPFLLGGVLVNRMYSLNMFRSESIVH